MSKVHGRPLKILKVLFIFSINILKSLAVQTKIMPIANEKRIGFVNEQFVS